MQRRAYVTILTTMGVSTFAGCGALETALGGKDEDEEKIERIKAEAKSPDWKGLMENTDDWEGEPVHYSDVGIRAVSEKQNGSFAMTIKHPEYSPGGPRLLHCSWFGDRIDTENDVDIWGTVKGTHTYSFDEERTVPKIRLADISPSE